MTVKTLRGVALVPGISRNDRWYTAEAIAGAVQRAQAKIKAGKITMRTHHDAGDDSTRVVGRVTKLEIGPAGEALFEAQLANTKHGKTIAKLVAGNQPFVKGVSIRGAWRGKVQRATVGGRTVETAPGLDLDGLDFTANPGVPGAQVNVAESMADRLQAAADSRSPAASKPRRRIFEEAPGPVVVADAAPTLEELAVMPADDFAALAARHLGAQHDAVRGTYRPAGYGSGA